MALVSFDLDGVLQRNPFRGDRPDGVYGRIARLLAPHMPQTDPDEAASEAKRRILAEYRRRTRSGQLVAAHDWDGIVAQIGAEAGYTDAIDVGQMVAECCRQPGLAYLYPGAEECLRSLLQAGHTLISITNGYRSYQEPVLRSFGILDLFTAVITPDGAGAAKPEPGIFAAGELFGGAPRIHVGDTLPHDMAGAKRRGWIGIYICQMAASNSTPLPEELAALPPWERPAQAGDWLAHRLQLERPDHYFPPCESADCLPDAIVDRLDEIPATVAHLTARH